MPPGPTTLLPVLGAETLPGAADLAPEALGVGAAYETLGQTGPRVDEPRARRLAGSTTHPRVALRHDATRFSGLPDPHFTSLLSHLEPARPVDETRPALETSARVDQSGVNHFWPLIFVAGTEPDFGFLLQSFDLSPTLLPARVPESSLPRPSLPQVRTPSSSDLIGEIFGGRSSGSRESRPVFAPPVARAVPSDATAGPDVFRSRVVRSVPLKAEPPKGTSLKGVPPKPPRPFSRVLDPFGTSELIMNPLTLLPALDRIGASNPLLPLAEDIAAVTLGLTGLKTEMDRNIDDAFTPLPLLTAEAREALEVVRDGLKLTYNEALARVPQTFTKARQSGFVILELQDVETLSRLAGVNYGVGRCMGVMELTRLIRDEILGPRGIQHRAHNLSQVFHLARSNASSLAGTNSRQNAAFPGVSPDARSLRPEERDDTPVDVTDAPLVAGTTASAEADADADDQGEERDNPNP